MQRSFTYSLDLVNPSKQFYRDLLGRSHLLRGVHSLPQINDESWPHSIKMVVNTFMSFEPRIPICLARKGIGLVKLKNFPHEFYINSSATIVYLSRRYHSQIRGSLNRQGHGVINGGPIQVCEFRILIVDLICQSSQLFNDTFG